MGLERSTFIRRESGPILQGYGASPCAERDTYAGHLNLAPNWGRGHPRLDQPPTAHAGWHSARHDD